jgi:sortase A
MTKWLASWFQWTLIGLGLGCLGTVGYAALDAQHFEQAQAASFAHAGPAVADVTIRLAPGDTVGVLSMPRVGLSTAVVEGDDSRSLKRSAGHLPDTPWPWDAGNSAIAGHRDGRFRALRKVLVGDEIRLQTRRGELVYRVRALSIVDPGDLSVLRAGEHASLTLITCYPFNYLGNAPQRFIVHAERVTALPAEGGQRQQ